jgi:hypothetical protein
MFHEQVGFALLNVGLWCAGHYWVAALHTAVAGHAAYRVFVVGHREPDSNAAERRYVSTQKYVFGAHVASHGFLAAALLFYLVVDVIDKVLPSVFV